MTRVEALFTEDSIESCLEDVLCDESTDIRSYEELQ